MYSKYRNTFVCQAVQVTKSTRIPRMLFILNGMPISGSSFFRDPDTGTGFTLYETRKEPFFGIQYFQKYPVYLILYSADIFGIFWHFLLWSYHICQPVCALWARTNSNTCPLIVRLQLSKGDLTWTPRHSHFPTGLELQALVGSRRPLRIVTFRNIGKNNHHVEDLGWLTNFAHF